jgi:hypothetical protein
MPRPGEVLFELECGARVTVRVEVDVSGCRDGDGRCPTPSEVVAWMWMGWEEAGEPAPTPDDCDSDGG